MDTKTDLPSLPVTQPEPATCAGPNCAVSTGSGSSARELFSLTLAGWRVRAQWDSDGWYHDLKDADDTRETHILTLMHCRSKDGLRLWAACLCWLFISWGRTDQTPNGTGEQRPKPAL